MKTTLSVSIHLCAVTEKINARKQVHLQYQLWMEHDLIGTQGHKPKSSDKNPIIFNLVLLQG